MHEDVADRFVEKLKAAVTKMYGKHPSQSPHFARMISKKVAERVASCIVEGKIVLGGRSNVSDRYVEPTLLYPRDWNDPAMQQEVFRPVLSALPYKGLNSFIANIKTRDKRLAAYVFSRDPSVVDKFIGSVSFGDGCVNMTNLHCWVWSLSFGGVGNSGTVRYFDKVRFEALSNTKPMLISPADRIVDV